MRERLLFIPPARSLHGITPAYAGKTSFVSKDLTYTGDHPRVCGKDHWLAWRRMVQRGSPPRMRERHKSIYMLFRSNRITPAYAGKTLKNPNKIAIFPRLNSKNYLLFKAIIIAHHLQFYYYARNFNNSVKLKTRCAVSLASRRALCGMDSAMLYSCSTVFNW